MAGERTAIELVLDEQHGEADVEDAQLGLFAPPATVQGAAKRAELVSRRGPGRPLGARNKRTEATVAFLLARHRDPRAVLLEIAQANVADLAALYQCTLFEAAQEKRLAATAVLPYTAARMPLAVDVTKRSAVYLTIIDDHLEQREDDGAGVVAAILENVQYQEVSDAPPAAVGQQAVGQSSEVVAPAQESADPAADPGSAGDALDARR